MSHFDFVLWTASFVTFFSTVCESQNDIYLPTEKWRQFHGFIYLCKNHSQQLARVYQRTFEKQNDLHIQKWKFRKIHFIFIVAAEFVQLASCIAMPTNQNTGSACFFSTFFNRLPNNRNQRDHRKATPSRHTMETIFYGCNEIVRFFSFIFNNWKPNVF